METVVLIIMLLVALSFLLKLSWHGVRGMAVTVAVIALAVGLSWQWAVEQSKTQIADWLERPELLLDISVLLTVDVMFQMAFCVLMAKRIAGSRLRRWENMALAVVFAVPGLLIFGVLFSMLVAVIFAFPGQDFAMTSWAVAAAVAVGAPLGAAGIRYLLPERDLRLELIFLINALTAVLGVVATVNGRTAAAGTNSVEWTALGGVFVLMLTGAVAGFFIDKRNTLKTIKKLK